jgi:hypothetical protein
MDPASYRNNENLRVKPLSVQYACTLLHVQATLWAVAAVGTALVWTDLTLSGVGTACHSELTWIIVKGICSSC